MHIYILHIVAVSGIRIAMLKARIGSPYLMLPVCTLAGVLLPSAVSPILTQATNAISGARPVVQPR